MDQSLHNFVLCSHGPLRAAELGNPVLSPNSESFSKPCIPNNGLPTHNSVISNFLIFIHRKRKWLLPPLVTRWAVWPSAARSLSFWQAADVQAPCPRGQQKARGRGGARIQGAQGKNSFLSLEPLWGWALGRWCLLSPSDRESQPEAWGMGASKHHYWSSSGSLHFKITQVCFLNITEAILYNIVAFTGSHSLV